MLWWVLNYFRPVSLLKLPFSLCFFPELAKLHMLQLSHIPVIFFNWSIIVLQCYIAFRCKTQWFDILIHYKMIPTSLFTVTIKVIKILTMLPILCFISTWLIYYVTHPSTLFLSGNHHLVFCFCESVSLLLCLVFCFDFLISCIHKIISYLPFSAWSNFT